MPTVDGVEIAKERQPPKHEDNRRLELTDLPAFIDRADAGRWTALAIVPSGHSADDHVRSAELRGIPKHQIARIGQLSDAAGAEALSQLTNLSSLVLR